MNSKAFSPVRTLAISAFVSAVTFGFATVSSAEGRAEPPQVIVKFADLNVSTARGAAALYSRIHDAAVDVCSRMYYTNASYVRHSDACLQQLIADAVLKVNEPALSAVFASRYGVAAPVRLAAAEAR